MAGLGGVATTAIITKGLTCGHGPLAPCRHGLITTPFSLYCSVAPTPPAISGGGGPYPRDAWNKLNPGDIKSFYQPVPEEYYLVPRDQEERYFRRHKVVKIVVKLGEFTAEKEYSVPERKAASIVKVFNLIDATKQHIDVAVTNVKRVTSSVVMSIKNLRLKK
jgi:hypothetical protein